MVESGPAADRGRSAWRIAAVRVVTLLDRLQRNRHGCEIATCY
jgi:hypothetical protein